MEQQGARRASLRDRKFLRFIGEQFVVTLPQLAVLIGRSDRSARWLRTRWQRAGWIDARQFFTWAPTFCWPTGAGLHVAGLPYKAWQPAGAGTTLLKMAGLVEVRLAVERQFPHVLWTPRRDLFALRRDDTQPEHLPDALLTLDGTEVAIELIEDKLDGRAAGRRMELSLAAYGRVVFFAPPNGAKRLREIAERESNVSIVEFSHDLWQPGALVLPSLHELVTDLPEPESDRWDDSPPFTADQLGNAPSSDEWGALSSQEIVEPAEIEQSSSDVPRIRLRTHDDYASTPQPRARRGWRL